MNLQCKIFLHLTDIFNGGAGKLAKKPDEKNMAIETGNYKLSDVHLDIIIDSIDEAIVGCDKNGYINI